MPMQHKGLAKLVEECGEVTQIAGKMIQYPESIENPDFAHPDGNGTLRIRLLRELADVAASSVFVREKFSLNDTEFLMFANHVAEKLALFRKWDRET